MRIFATYNIKGGVGKTATAVNLAYLSARAGARTLLWDLDPQGAATFYFRVEPRVEGGIKRLLRDGDPDALVRGTDFPGLHLLPADFSYRKLDQHLGGGKPSRALARLLQPLDRRYDHLFLDCAPGITLSAEAVFVASDALLVPVIPTTLSLRTLDQLARHLGKKGPRRLAVLPFFCMVDRRKRLHRDTADRAAGPFPFLSSQIPYASLVEQMGTRRAPVPAFAPWSQAAQSYQDLWQEVQARTR